MSQGVIVSLCDRTGNMVKPWSDAGYDCFCYDIRHKVKKRIGSTWFMPADLSKRSTVEDIIFGHKNPLLAFAFPPCTHLAVSGSRWFRDKGLTKLWQALRLVDNCRLIVESFGCPYMVENPVSTLSTYWRPYDYSFHPHEFGGYEGGNDDNYTKKTCLWTGKGFPFPRKKKLKDKIPDKRIHYAVKQFPGKKNNKARSDFKSITPMGFAQAVFESYHDPSGRKGHNRLF